MVTSPLRSRVMLASSLYRHFVGFFCRLVRAKRFSAAFDFEPYLVSPVAGLSDVTVPSPSRSVVSLRSVLAIDRAIRFTQVAWVAARSVMALMVDFKPFCRVSCCKEIGGSVRVSGAQAKDRATDFPVPIFVPRAIPFPAARSFGYVAPEVRGRVIFHRDTAAKGSKVLSARKHRPVSLAKSIRAATQVRATGADAGLAFRVLERRKRHAAPHLSVVSVAQPFTSSGDFA